MQKAGLVENSEKAVVGLFQGLSIFSTSQLFFLISFLGLIGVLIWFVQPSSESAESAESSDEQAAAAKKKQASQKDDLVVPEEFAKQKQGQPLTSSKPEPVDTGSLKRRKIARQIDTIYETVGEQSDISEEFSTARNAKLQKQAAKQSASKQTESTIEQSIEDLLTSLTSSTKLNIEILNEDKQRKAASREESQGAEDESNIVKRKIKTKVSLEDTMEQSPDELIDQLINDLVTDEKEEYAYNKHDKRAAKLNEPDVSSIHTASTSNLESQSRNSLLGEPRTDFSFLDRSCLKVFVLPLRLV